MLFRLQYAIVPCMPAIKNDTAFFLIFFLWDNFCNLPDDKTGCSQVVEINKYIYVDTPSSIII